MRHRIILPRALLLTALAALVFPSAAAAPGGATVCSDAGTGACVTATLTPTVLACVGVGAGWQCQVAWQMRLDVTGPTCAWAWSSESGEVLTCNPFPIETWVTATTTRTYDVPAGGATVTADAYACVDYATPLQRCAPFQASVDLPA